MVRVGLGLHQRQPQRREPGQQVQAGLFGSEAVTLIFYLPGRMSPRPVVSSVGSLPDSGVVSAVGRGAHVGDQGDQAIFEIQART